MAANGPPSGLLNILNIPLLAQYITDYTLIANNEHPVELDNLLEYNAFFDSLRPLIPLGLQQMAFTRRWIVVRFVDRQRQALGFLDTPINCQLYVQNMELVHELDITPIGMTAAQHAAADYGLRRNMLTGMHFRLNALRTTLTHEFNFVNDNLQAIFGAHPARRTQMHARLMQWMLDIVNQPPTTYQIWVCLSDSIHARDVDQEHDERVNVANGQLASISNQMLHDGMGAVFRLR